MPKPSPSPALGDNFVHYGRVESHVYLVMRAWYSRANDVERSQTGTYELSMKLYRKEPDRLLTVRNSL